MRPFLLPHIPAILLYMKDSLYSTITHFVDEHTLIPDKATIVIGLSGGPDSVFLLHYLHALSANHNITLIAAHLDHEWRKESAEDAQWCRTLTESLGIPFVTAKISELELTIKHNGSKEEYARKARRHFFERVRKEYLAHGIALAHHADDQQENFFIRLSRGASLQGLVGMKPRNGLYIRPLLTIHKIDIMNYLTAHKISYLSDPTNDSNNFLRNRIRNTVLPALKIADERFTKNFARTLHQLSATEQFLEKLTLDTFNDLRTDETGASLNLKKFLELDSIVQHRILLHWFCLHKIPHTPSQALFNEILRFLKTAGDNKQHLLYQQWKLSKKGLLISIS